jgi:hypothetical protein
MGHRAQLDTFHSFYSFRAEICAKIDQGFLPATQLGMKLEFASHWIGAAIEFIDFVM